MEKTKWIACPQCGQNTPQLARCGHCGKDLPPATSPNPSTATTATPTPTTQATPPKAVYDIGMNIGKASFDTTTGTATYAVAVQATKDGRPFDKGVALIGLLDEDKVMRVLSDDSEEKVNPLNIPTEKGFVALRVTFVGPRRTIVARAIGCQADTGKHPLYLTGAPLKPISGESWAQATQRAKKYFASHT